MPSERNSCECWQSSDDDDGEDQDQDDEDGDEEQMSMLLMTMMMGMVTLREGELESISSIVPTGPEEELEEAVPPPQGDDAVGESEKDPSEQPWQNRWRRQSSPQAEGESLEVMPSESLRPSGMVKFKTQSEHEDDQASMSRRDSMDSADRAFAPVVSERSRMSHASVASEELQGPESRRVSGFTVGGPREESHRKHCAERRRALAAAESAGGSTASLQTRIQRRQLAMQEAERTQVEEAAPFPNPRTPEFGEAATSPRSPVASGGAEERRRKSRRITFSAMNNALDELGPDQPEPSRDASIQAAQDLVRAMSYRGAKRGADGQKRSSVGKEAMLEKAKLLVSDTSANDDAQDSRRASLAEELPLLATPGRFRDRDGQRGVFEDPWSTLAPRKSSPSKELASEGKLVSLHGGEADIPLLPAPVTVESRRRTVVAREIQPPPPPTETIQTPREAPSEQPVRRPSQEKMPAVQAVQEKPPEERAALPEPTDSSTAFENIQVRKEELPPPELPKQLPLSEDRPSTDRPRSKSRTSVSEAVQRPIRADGLQELLQEVYDKFRTCSAHLRQTGSRQVVSPPGEPVAGSEDTDLADTWQEVEWLRQAVVGMHSHLLLAQKRQHALEKKCKDFQDRISEVRNGVAGGDMEDTAATVSTPVDVRRRKQELLVPQQEPTLTTSTVASYDSLQRRPQQYLQVPSQVVTPVSTALQGSGTRWAESPRTAASTPQLSARTRVVYDQSTLPRPHEVQTVLATPPRQLRSPAAVYATPLLPGQATPPQPQRGRLPETAPVYARREISAATPPHPYVRTAVSATPPRGRSEAKWVRSEAMSTLVPALAANPMDVLSRSLTPNRSAPMSLPMQVEPLTSPRAVSASPAKGVRAWLSPSTHSTGASTGPAPK
eukprot:s1296_g3.t1